MLPQETQPRWLEISLPSPSSPESSSKSGGFVSAFARGRRIEWQTSARSNPSFWYAIFARGESYPSVLSKPSKARRYSCSALGASRFFGPVVRL